MNIVYYYISFLSNVDVKLRVLVEKYFGNEGVDMVLHVIIFLHSPHPLHLSSLHSKLHPLYSLIHILLVYTWR
jgi:hypothetical protein